MKPAVHPLLTPATWSQRLAVGTGLAVACGGLLVLLGWWLKIDVLVQGGPDHESVKFNAGLCYLLLGLALVGQARSGRPILRRRDTSHGCQDHTTWPYAARPYAKSLDGLGTLPPKSDARRV